MQKGYRCKFSMIKGEDEDEISGINFPDVFVGEMLPLLRKGLLAVKKYKETWNS